MLPLSNPSVTAEDDAYPFSGFLLSRILSQKGRSQLDMRSCLLSEVPVDEILFYFGKPDNLNLSSNYIARIPQNFPLRFGTLTRLDLSRNELKRLPDNFGLMDQLSYLDVHHNQLQMLPLSMARMTRLTYLDITDNVFQSPLCNLLQSKQLIRSSREMEPSLYAESAREVISILTQLSKEVFTLEHYSSISPASQRGVTFETNEIETSVTTSFHGDEEERSDHTFEVKRDSIQSLPNVAEEPELEVFTFKDHSSTSSATRGGDNFESDENDVETSETTSFLSDQEEWLDDVFDFKRVSTQSLPNVDNMNISQRDVTMSPPRDLQKNKLSVWTSLALGICLIILAVVLLPVLTALIYSTHYLDDAVGNYALWKFYKPYHVTAEGILETLYIIENPSPPPSESGNFLTGLQSMFAP